MNTITITLQKDQVKEVYDFIREHLDVINDVPAVEQLMIDLEEYVDLGEYNSPISLLKDISKNPVKWN